MVDCCGVLTMMIPGHGMKREGLQKADNMQWEEAISANRVYFLTGNEEKGSTWSAMSARKGSLVRGAIYGSMHQTQGRYLQHDLQQDRGDGLTPDPNSGWDES